MSELKKKKKLVCNWILKSRQLRGHVRTKRRRTRRTTIRKKKRDWKGGGGGGVSK